MQGFKQETGTVRFIFQRGHCNCPIVQHMLAILSENRQSYLTSMEIFLYVINVNPASRIHMQTQVQKICLNQKSVCIWCFWVSCFEHNIFEAGTASKGSSVPFLTPPNQ